MGLRERLARGFSALLRGPDTDGFIFDQENLTACRDQFRALSVSERGLIFLNSNRGTLHLLRRGDPVIRKVAILSAHCGWASWLAPDSGIIVALDDRGARLIVDLSGSSGLCGLVRDFGNSISGVVGISFTPDGQSLAISHFREHFGFYLDLISPHNGQIIETIHKDTCSGIFQFSLDGTRLFRECRDRRIAIHDAGSFRQISLSPPLPGSPLSLVQLPGTSTLIAAGCFSAPALIRLPERDRLLSASPPSTKLKPDPELFTIKGRDMNAPPSAQIQIRDPWTREIHLELPETAAALLAALKPPLELDDGMDSPLGRRPRIHDGLRNFLCSLALFKSRDALFITWGTRLLQIASEQGEIRTFNFEKALDRFKNWKELRVVPVLRLSKDTFLFFLRGYEGDGKFQDLPMLIRVPESGNQDAEPVIRFCSSGLPGGSAGNFRVLLCPDSSSPENPVPSEGTRVLIRTRQDAGAMAHVDEFMDMRISYLLEINETSMELTLIDSNREKELRTAETAFRSGAADLAEAEKMLVASLDDSVIGHTLSLDRHMELKAHSRESGTHVLTLEHSIDSPFTVKWNQKARSPGRHVNQLLCYRQGDIFSTGQGEQKEALMIDLISCPGLARFLVRSPLTVK